MSLRACVTVVEVWPPRTNRADFVFSTSFGARASRARFIRWFFGLLTYSVRGWRLGGSEGGRGGGRKDFYNGRC